MVENAQAGTAPVQRLVDRISAVFVPVVVAIAVLTFAGWMLHDGAFEHALIAAVSAELAGRVGERVVISILAGMPGHRVREALGGRCRVVRAMPNLPAKIGHGATAVCMAAGARDGDDEFARRLFEGVGRLVVTIDESMMDAFTAVAGSGPAYLFLLAEAMVHAAAEIGFDEATANDIVRQTIAGAAALLSESVEAAGELRKAVTSKGGTTEAALRVLNDAGFTRALQRAVTAARDRGRELGAM
jgi:pyrroline-5-carboxylate reductase